MIRGRNSFLFATFSLLSLLTLSCVDEMEEEVAVTPDKEGHTVEAGPHVIFTAASESTDDTKASLYGFDVVWSAGDEISISDNIISINIPTIRINNTKISAKDTAQMIKERFKF